MKTPLPSDEQLLALYAAEGVLPSSEAMVVRYRNTIQTMMNDQVSNARIAAFLGKTTGIKLSGQWLGKIIARLGWPDPRRKKNAIVPQEPPCNSRSDVKNVPVPQPEAEEDSDFNRFSALEGENVQERRKRHSYLH